MRYLLSFILLMVATPAFATTYYAGPSGSGTTCSDSVPCSLATALGNLNTGSGHTVVLKDGTYGAINNPANGTSGAYNTIKAQNDGGAIVQSTSSTPLVLDSDYVRLEGLKFSSNINGSSDVCARIGGGHNKLFRCSFVSTPTLTYSSGNDISNVIIAGSYNLLEDCWAWGGGRYKFLIYGGNDGGSSGSYNILRRCIARHDRENSCLLNPCTSSNPQANFIAYTGRNNMFQNCIAIDSDQTTYYYNANWRGGFVFEKAMYLEAGNSMNYIRGSIALLISSDAIGEFNAAGGSYIQDHTITDVVAWDITGGLRMDYPYDSRKDIIVDHATIGLSSEDSYENGAYSGFRACGAQATAYGRITNSIVTDITGNNTYGIYGATGANNYNSFYGNTANRGNSTTGANDITAVNPRTNSLLYLPRIESGSSLKGAGSSGSDIGATILYKWGTSGSAYGETGYDTITTDPIWPWPNEERIKTEMSSYPSNWPSGNLPNPVRGFTADTSLTTYIWEYLGNTIPADIYGEEPPVVNGACGTNSGGSFESLTSGTTGNCANGTVASFSGTGPWTWGCDGSGGGTSTAYTACSATLAADDGCDYYIRPDGNNTNSGTSDTSGGAWLTLQKAADTIVAGNTVCVSAGSYAGFYVETSGSAGSPITFKASGAVNITSANSRTTDGINIESWTATPADYIVIDGFSVYSRTRMGIRAIDGTGITIKNNVVYNNGDCGIFSSNTPSINILNNTTYGNGNASTEHNIYVSNAESDSPVIRGNIVYSSGGGNGIQLNGDWQEGGDGFIDNAIIEDNLVYTNSQKGLSLISVRYGRIQNNVIYGNGMSSGAGGVHIVDQLGQNFSINNSVVNNTIDEPTIATVRINSGNTGNVVFNNVSIGSTGIVFEGSGNYQSNNLTTTTGFANYAGHDYSLIAGSNKIDAGLATYQSKAAATDDILGISRPQSSVYDVGAYEFENGTPPAVTAALTGGTCKGCITTH